jgi:hypothetical protein
MTTFKTLMAAASLPVREVRLCLRGDLVAEHEAADRALVEAQRSPSTSKEDGGIGQLVAEVERLQQEMRDSTYPFRLRALGPRFRLLMAAHPPRRGDDDEPDALDVQAGFNRDTFFEALVKVSTVDPEMGVDVEKYFEELSAGGTPVLPDGDWPELFEKLTDRQWNDLVDTAWALNRDKVSVPFSLAASRAKRDSDGE